MSDVPKLYFTNRYEYQSSKFQIPYRYFFKLIFNDYAVDWKAVLDSCPSLCCVGKPQWGKQNFLTMTCNINDMFISAETTHISVGNTFS